MGKYQWLRTGTKFKKAYIEGRLSFEKESQNLIDFTFRAIRLGKSLNLWKLQFYSLQDGNANSWLLFTGISTIIGNLETFLIGKELYKHKILVLFQYLEYTDISES